MNASHRTARRSIITDATFNPRFLTLWIPPRVRGVTMLVGTIVLFPLIVGAIMLDAVTHDMPRLRTPLKNALRIAIDWMRLGSGILRTKRATGPAAFAGLIEDRASLAS
jgi:hypothetical protein